MGNLHITLSKCSSAYPSQNAQFPKGNILGDSCYCAVSYSYGGAVNERSSMEVIFWYAVASEHNLFHTSTAVEV